MRQIVTRTLATAALAILSSITLTACAGDQPGAQEPTAASKADDDAPKVPDMPGGSGEAKDKPAGTGQANAAAPAAEKSQPEAAAAKTPGKAGAAVNLKPGEATVAIGALNVRSGASSKSSVKRTVKKGEKVTIKECKGGWCEIGEGEWAAARYLNQ